MQIPILSGIEADGSPEFRTSYPVNMKPIPKPQGISQGYLRTVEGLTQTGTGPDVSRGGIFWGGVLYRVMGQKLVRVAKDGTVTVLGDVGGTGPVTMAYSFDRLAVASGGKLFYWDGSALAQVTDPDLGTVLSVEWIDGYFITTDGEFIVTTELLDPTAVDPLKYGSSEVDPDPINAVRKVRNELYAVNRYSIEAYSNVGGTGFPFQVIRGAQTNKGAVGPHASVVIDDVIAVVGGGRKESIGVHLCGNGTSQKISTREIDTLLAGYTEAQIAAIEMEVLEDRNNSTLMVHLHDVTMCYDLMASKAMGQQIWYFMASGVGADSRYRGRHFVYGYGQWNVADAITAAVGVVDYDTAKHWGSVAGWRFGLPIIYNEAKGALVHSLELVGTFGAAVADSVITAEWSDDGETWSTPMAFPLGSLGARTQRPRWMRQGIMRQRRMYRFQGDGNAPCSIAACEAQMEPLAW